MRRPPSTAWAMAPKGKTIKDEHTVKVPYKKPDKDEVEEELKKMGRDELKYEPMENSTMPVLPPSPALAPRMASLWLKPKTRQRGGKSSMGPRARRSDP